MPSHPPLSKKLTRSLTPPSPQAKLQHMVKMMMSLTQVGALGSYDQVQNLYHAHCKGWWNMDPAYRVRGGGSARGSNFFLGPTLKSLSNKPK